MRNPSHSPDTVLARIAARQHGVVRTADLRAAGLSSSAASRRRARGRLHRIHPGVDAVGHRALSREGWFLAAVLAAGDGAALSRLAAAELWGISRFRHAPVTVVAPRQVRIAGVCAQRCGRLDPRDVTRHRAIPVTTVARTIVDLADVLAAGQLANVMYEAAFHSQLDLDAVESAADRLAGRRRLHVLADAIAAHRAGSAGTRSGREDAFHALAWDGLPTPIANVKVRGVEVDAFWPELRLIAEIDGPGHLRPRARRRDRERDRALTAAGYTVLRFAADEVECHPGRVLAALRDAIRRAGDVRRRSGGRPGWPSRAPRSSG